jgi:Fe-S-cluster-containing dehydrogenase component
MERNGLLINYEYCTGCHSCEVACKEEHNLAVGKWGIKLCEVGPFQISENKWQMSTIPVPTDLCTLCAGRVKKGKKPACVHDCNNAVMKFGPVDELAMEMVEGARMVLFAPKDHSVT